MLVFCVSGTMQRHMIQLASNWNANRVNNFKEVFLRHILTICLTKPRKAHSKRENGKSDEIFQNGDILRRFL